jgi:hypothetical protein
MKSFALTFISAVIALFLGAFLCPVFAQTWPLLTPDGRPIVIPESSIQRPGRIHTNYFFANRPGRNQA